MTTPSQQTAEFTLPNGMTIVSSAKAKGDVRFLYSEIFEDRCYEQHGIQIADGAVVVDAGANIGLFALRVIDVAPNATVYCFEPAPPNYTCLTHNVAQRAGIITFNAALMARPATFDLAFYPQIPGNSTLYPECKSQEAAQFARHATMRQVWQFNKLASVILTLLYPFARRIAHFLFKRMLHDVQTYTCHAMTLDQLFREQRLTAVDLLKIDVECSEQAVLEGLSDENLSNIKQLVIEISPASKPWLPALEARLQRAGFDRLVLESIVRGGEARSDVFPCSLYATRTAPAQYA